MLPPLAIEVLKQLPGWSCVMGNYSVPIFLNPQKERFKLVILLDPFGKIASEAQVVSENCFPAQRGGLIKIEGRFEP